MRPHLFRSRASALRFSRFGGVALYLPHAERECETPAVYGSPTSFDSDGWAFWWAGRVGVSMAEVIDRGTPAQGVKLTRGQAEDLAQYATSGIGRPSFLTTVLYFTGTRHGMTPEQADTLRLKIFECDLRAAHHGLCVGSDHQFHDMVYRLKDSAVDLVPWLCGWPARVPENLTVVDQVRCDELRAARPPLDRNEAMAADAHANKLKGAVCRVELVATPHEYEQPASGRGGTWHAVRAFRSAGIPVSVITPDGAVLS